MCSNRIKIYSLAILLLGFLTIFSVRAGFAQEPAAAQEAIATNINPNPTTASYAYGQKYKFRATVVSVEACQLTVCDQCGVQSVVLVGDDAEIKVNGGHRQHDLSGICPGDCVKIEGRGNCSCQLLAEEIKSRCGGCNACQPACCQPACPTACAPPACPAPCNPCGCSH